MRRALVLMAIAGVIAGLAATTGASRAETVDTLPVLVPDRPGSAEFTFVYGQDAAGRSPTPRLGVFRAAARPSDAIPPSAEPTVRPGRERSRLLLDRPALQIYAYPTTRGEVCYVLAPRSESGCLPFLFDGAYPQVRPWQDVWGLVDDRATGVDVRLGSGWRPAELGRNAFYLPLPANVAAPDQILVHERTGPDHRYLVKACRIRRPTPLAGASPIGPGPCG